MDCRFCGEKMWLDDWDSSDYGVHNFNMYWVCDLCNASCIEGIVCSVSVGEHWHREDNQGNVLFDQTISKL